MQVVVFYALYGFFLYSFSVSCYSKYVKLDFIYAFSLYCERAEKSIERGVIMKKSIVISALLFVLCAGIWAAEKTAPKSPWDFSVTTDFAYYPKSAYKSGSSGTSHFAPITGIYSGLEFRVTGTAGYTIPVPFGKNALVKDNKLRFYADFELSPVSLAPALGVSFTPIAFLNFSAGTSIGAAWDFIGIQGLAKWDPLKYDENLKKSGSYESLPFKSARWDAWLQGALMFDLAAVVPGDWNHVITYNSYKAMYRGITSGGENGNPWLYQGSGEKINGWQYEANFIFGYQMPIVLQTVAVQAELSGQYNGKKDFAERYHKAEPDFMNVSISPILLFKFGKKDALTTQFQFSSRRRFAKEYTKSKEMLIDDLNFTGREWYFNRIALSYKHSF